jgi:peptide/nickel transport system substrate-binding protein
VLPVLLISCTSAPEDDAAPALTAPDPVPTQEPTTPASTVQGGTVAVAVADEPTTLHPWMAAPDSSVGMLVRPMLAPLWRVRPDGTSEPWLLAEQPAVREATATEPFTVTYRIRDDAVWSDGEPIDGGDVLFTLETCLRDAPHDDCAAVDLSRSSADGRQVTVAFERPVAAWATILQSLPVLPEHRLRGRAPRTAWTRRIDVSSGPFRFASWTPGERLVLERNDRWWGEPPALDRIEFRFTGHDTVTGVVGGVVDVAQVPASPAAVEQAQAEARLRSIVGAGSQWAALDFNLTSQLVGRRTLRRALASAIDRTTVVDELIRPVDPATAVLDELPGGPRATEGQALLFPGYDAARAARELDAAGCAVGDGGVRMCGDQPLEIDLVTTSDDWQQAVIADYVRSQLTAVGVGVRRARLPSDPPDGEASAVPSEPGAEGDDGRQWDLRVSAVGVASDGGRRWHCDDPANTQGFCEPRYDDLVERASTTTDPEQRAALDAQAALLLSSDLPTYPLYEMPAILVHSRGVRGPALSRLPWGLTWNVDEWARTAD